MSDHIGSVELRAVVPDDLEIFFRQQQDPESNDLAKVFPRSRSYFDAHWEQSLCNPTVIVRTILLDGVVAGRVTSFTVEGTTMVGYWIERAHWGKGIATRAMEAFVGTVDIRPLHAQVATSNIGSIKVLERCGFVKIGEKESPEDERYAACIEAEYILR